MANIPVSTAIDNLLKSTTSTAVTTAQALTALGAATKGDASIVAADLATGAVTTAKILDANVTAAKLATSAVDLNTSTVTGTLPVNRGGTGAATLTANNVLIGAGTSAPTFVAPSTAGNVLTSNGTTWVSSAGTTPTNETVNTAINTDPAETRYALSVERKQNFGTSIQNLRGATSKNLRVVTFGDSLVGQGTPLNLSGVIPSAGGFCEASLSAAISSMTITANSTTDTFTSASHGLLAGDIVSVSSNITLPTNLSVDTPYFVITVATDTFQLSATLGGSAINIDSNGSGTITLFRTALAADWTYPGGRYAYISSGQTRRWGKAFVTFSAYPFDHASIFKIYYIRGTGTLRLRSATGVSTTFTDIAGHTAIDTSTGGAAGTIGVRTVTLTSGNIANFYRIDTVCDSGTVKILCVQALANTAGSRDSYHLSCLGLGGSEDSQWITCPQDNWTAVLTEMNPHLIVFKAADFHIANKTLAGNWAIVLDRIRTAAPNAVMLLIDSHPHSANTDPAVDNTGWSAGLKAYAALNAPMVQFVECRKFWPNYATMLSNSMISADGIHLTDPTGRAFESALVLDHVSTLTVAPHINEILATKIFSRLAGVIGTVKSAYLSGPEWGVTGDLANANGYIGMFNQIGTNEQPLAAPHLIAYSANNSNIKMANAFALGLSRTSHQIFISGQNPHRIILGNLGNVESTVTRDANSTVEVLGTSVTVPTFSVGAVASQTADMVQYRTGVTAAASGTLATALGPAGALITVPVAHPNSYDVTISIASPCVITKSAHGLFPNQQIVFTTTGALPTGLAVATRYFVLSTGFTTGTFQVSATLNGAAINTTGSQSGVHTVTPLIYTESPVTSLTTTGVAQTAILANGVAGQVKTITCVAVGTSTITVAPDTKTGFATITFTNIADTVTLQYYAVIGWVIVSIRGAVAA